VTRSRCSRRSPASRMALIRIGNALKAHAGDETTRPHLGAAPDPVGSCTMRIRRQPNGQVTYTTWRQVKMIRHSTMNRRLLVSCVLVLGCGTACLGPNAPTTKYVDPAAAGFTHSRISIQYARKTANQEPYLGTDFWFYSVWVTGNIVAHLAQPLSPGDTLMHGEIVVRDLLVAKDSTGRTHAIIHLVNWQMARTWSGSRGHQLALRRRVRTARENLQRPDDPDRAGER
jgi:hypothetical protein